MFLHTLPVLLSGLCLTVQTVLTAAWAVVGCPGFEEPVLTAKATQLLIVSFFEVFGSTFVILPRHLSWS